MTNQKKESENKCVECNMNFETRDKLEQHRQEHSAISCPTCPIDMAISAISKLFRRNKHLT